MRVKVIGSGSMWTKYNSASYLIDDDILVDMPNGLCKYLFEMNLNPRVIQNVLITHFHGDHYFDMPFFYLLKSKAEHRVINVYSGKEGKKKISKILKLAFPNSAKNILLENKITYTSVPHFAVNSYSVSRYLLDHGRMKPAYGYIFDAAGKKVGFTGDTAMCEAVEQMASICDYLFCDCMFIKGNSKHMGIDSITYLSEKYPECKYVTSHMEDSTREALHKISLANIIVPNDGDEIIIS